jgi:tight adherence protein B
MTPIEALTPWTDGRALGPVFKWIGSALLLLGLSGVAAWGAADARALPRRYWDMYAGHLEARLGRLGSRTTGRTLVVGQALGFVACFALRVVLELRWWPLLAIAVLVGPPYWLERSLAQRVTAIDAQVDGLLVALSNALKATPSLGDAFVSVGALLEDPMRHEVAMVGKEMRFGATFDQALLSMSRRAGSRRLASALSAVLIGRQVGGDLPKILDSTAASLREMARLEGVVRTRTAEGTTQVWVLSAFPLFMVIGMSAIDPGHFDPLTSSVAGYVLVALALLLWGAALVVARNILAVDI